MKVYVVERDNGCEYEDYEVWIEDVFTSFRGASQYLIDNEFVPYAYGNWVDYHINFAIPKEGKHDRDVKGWITEYEVKGD